MSMISTASNALAQAAAVDQAVEAKAVVAVVVVVAAETGPDAALLRIDILLISGNNFPINTCSPSTT